MYFVFSYAIHNYRVKLAWDDRELEFKALETEIERMTSVLNNDEWLRATENKIRNSTPGKASDGIVLREEIHNILFPKEMSLSEKVTIKSAAMKENKRNEEEEMENLIGTLTPREEIKGKRIL